MPPPHTPTPGICHVSDPVFNRHNPGFPGTLAFSLVLPGSYLLPSGKEHRAVALIPEIPSRVSVAPGAAMVLLSCPVAVWLAAFHFQGGVPAGRQRQRCSPASALLVSFTP